MRIELSKGWAEIKDLKKISYGEAKRFRKIIAPGDEESVDKAIIACVVSWQVRDSSTDEMMTEVSGDTLDRMDPNDVVAIASAVAEGLSSALPKASKSE